MVEQHCQKLIMKTNLSVMDGKVCFPLKEKNISLTDIKPSMAEDGAFVFYSKENPEMEICKIAYTENREKHELYYDTISEHRNKGYMREAMEFTLNWLEHNGVRGSLWILIPSGNTASIKIAQRFKFVKQEESIGDYVWYCLMIGNND